MTDSNTIECASCDMEHDRDDSKRVIIGTVKDMTHKGWKTKYTFKGSPPDFWLCSHCVEEPLWSKLPTKPSLPVPSIGGLLYEIVYAIIKYTIVFLVWPTTVAQDVVVQETSLDEIDAELIGVLVFVTWVTMLIAATLAVVGTMT